MWGRESQQNSMAAMTALVIKIILMTDSAISLLQKSGTGCSLPDFHSSGCNFCCNERKFYLNLDAEIESLWCNLILSCYCKVQDLPTSLCSAAEHKASLISDGALGNYCNIRTESSC